MFIKKQFYIFYFFCFIFCNPLYAQLGIYNANGGGGCAGNCDSCMNFVEEQSCTGFYKYKDPIIESLPGDNQCIVWSVCQACDHGGFYLGGGSCAISCPLGEIPNGEGQCIPIPSNNGDGDNNTCSPINIATGNKYFDQVDYDADLVFKRFYNSMTGKWSFSFGQRLLINANGIDAYREDGKVIPFSFDGTNYTSFSQRKERLLHDITGYTLILPDSTFENYDSMGRLVKITGGNKEDILLTYTNNIMMVTQGNKSLEIELNGYDVNHPTNSNFYVSQVHFHDGSSISYDYFVSGGNIWLSEVEYSSGEIKRYLYENSVFDFNITGIVDENNNRISSVQYDSQGRAISSEKGPLNSGIERTQIAYNADGTRTVTNALGKQNTYHFTQFNGEYKITQVEGHPSANCAGANKNYTYDANGFMASKTDWANNVTTYIHNDRGQELSRTEASGTPQARTITTEWHADFNLPVRIIEPERETLMAYDENGRLLSRQVEPRSGL